MPSRQTNIWPDLSVFDPVTRELLDTQRTPPPEPQRQPVAMPQISQEHTYANSPEFKVIIQKAMESPESLTKTEQQQIQKAIDLGMIPDIFQQAGEKQAEEDLKPMKEALGKLGKELIETAKHPTIYQRGSLGMSAINTGRELIHIAERASGEFFGNILGIEQYTGRKLSEHLQDAFADVGLVPLGPDDPGASFEIENKFTGETETVKMTDAERAAANFFQNVITLAPTLLVTALENPVEFVTGIAKFPFEQATLLQDAALGGHITINEKGVTTRKLTDEEIDEARETLIQNPLGPVMATLMVAGAGRYVTRKARAAEARAAKIEAPKLKEKIAPAEKVAEKVVPKEEIPVEKEVVSVAPEKAAKEAPKPELPKAEVELKPIEGEVIGFKHAEVGRIRKALDLQEMSKVESRSWERQIMEAKDAKLDVNAVDMARQAIKSDRTISPQEQAGVFSRGVDAAKEFNDRLATHSELLEKGDVAGAKVELERIHILRDELDVLTQVSYQHAGTPYAVGLNFRRMMRKLEDNTPAGMVRRGRVFKGGKLTEMETGRLEQSGQKYENVRKRLEEVEGKLAESQVANEKLVAQDIATREVKQARIRKKAEKQHELIMLERSEIKAGLKKLGYRVNDITGVTAEGAYWVGRLAVSYIKEGATTLDAVVKKVLVDVPDLNAMDVYKSLANKEGRRQAKAQSDVTKRIRQLKRQADLLVRVENAAKGVFEPTKTRLPIPAEIRELQRQLTKLRTEAYRSQTESAKLEKAIQTINELQDQLDNRYRAVKKTKIVDTPEFAAAKEKMEELRKTMRVEDELARLNEQQRTGEYEVRERPKPKEVPAGLERLQVELDRARKRNRGEIEKLAPITVTRVAAETVGAARTAKATADLSGTLRQGLGLIMAEPGAFPKAFAKSLVATFSEFKAEAIDLAIRSHPNHYLRERAGVEFTELGGKLSGREEMISSNVMEKIPGYGRVVKGSQRHMTTFLNLMRASVFDGYLERYPNATRAELARWGNSVNVFSGRGTIGKYGGLAQWVAFAPRFAISRVETPYLVFRHWKEPRVRKEITKTYVRTAVLGGSLLAMAKLAGFDVGVSPRDPDFGKIVVGNTRIDIWAGVQQPVRLVTRIGLAFSDRVGITGKDLADSEKQLDPVELVGRFAAFKLAPAITIPTELLTSKTMVGEERTPTETAIHAVIPMVYEDILDAYKLESKEQAAVVGGLVTLGVGVSTYEDSKANVRREISKLLRENKRGDAVRKALEWNREHPDQPIRTVSGVRLTKARKKSVFAPER